MSPDTLPFLLLVLLAVACIGLILLWREAQTAGQGRAAAEAKLAAAQARLESHGADAADRESLRAEAARLAAELAAERSASAARAQAATDREQALMAMKAEVEKSFLALAAQALDRNEQRFLTLANETFEKHREAAQGGVKEVISPVQEAFAKLAGSVEALEKSRTEDKAALGEQMRQVAETLGSTQALTGKLVQALRAAPKTRGRWGEETLRNVLELSGLSPHADFLEQTTTAGDDGRALRPDVIIRVPGGRSIIVDAKVALSGYLDALEATDEASREAYLKKHAAELRAHVKALAAKDYSKFVGEAADFVALFIPGENFFAAAVERDPDLFEDAMKMRVVIVTPVTLMALARSIAYGWRQEDSAKNAQQIADLGRELYKRVALVADKMGDLGHSLQKAVHGYNAMVASAETRLLPQARRFKDLGAADSGVEIEELAPVDSTPRLPAPDLFASDAVEPSPAMAPKGRRR